MIDVTGTEFGYVLFVRFVCERYKIPHCHIAPTPALSKNGANFHKYKHKKKEPVSGRIPFFDFDDPERRLPFNRRARNNPRNLHARATKFSHSPWGSRVASCAQRLAGLHAPQMKRKEASMSKRIGVRILFVSLRRNHLLAAVETGRADVVTTMHFTGRSFDSGGRVGQKVMSTVITALVGGFLVLLNSHGKPHV